MSPPSSGFKSKPKKKEHKKTASGDKELNVWAYWDSNMEAKKYGYNVKYIASYRISDSHDFGYEEFSSSRTLHFVVVLFSVSCWFLS
jgi:hypothetical protein